jgi:hypothetical protein
VHSRQAQPQPVPPNGPPIDAAPCPRQWLLAVAPPAPSPHSDQWSTSTRPLLFLEASTATTTAAPAMDQQPTCWSTCRDRHWMIITLLTVGTRTAACQCGNDGTTSSTINKSMVTTDFCYPIDRLDSGNRRRSSVSAVRPFLHSPTSDTRADADIEPWEQRHDPWHHDFPLLTALPSTREMPKGSNSASRLIATTKASLLKPDAVAPGPVGDENCVCADENPQPQTCVAAHPDADQAWRTSKPAGGDAQPEAPQHSKHRRV